MAGDKCPTCGSDSGDVRRLEINRCNGGMRECRDTWHHLAPIRLSPTPPDPADDAVVEAARAVLAQCAYSIHPDGTELVTPHHIGEFNRAMLVLRAALRRAKGGA